MLCYEIGLAGPLVKLNCYLDAQLYGRTYDHFLFSCTVKKSRINIVGIEHSLSNC